MAINEEQLRLAEASFLTFKIALGEDFEPYSTETVQYENAKTLAAWGVENIQGGINAAATLGFWDISFRNCLAAGTLKRDPSWKSKAERNAALAEDFATQTAAESKERYANDAEFARFIDGR